MTTYTYIHADKDDVIRVQMTNNVPTLVIGKQYGTDTRIFLGNSHDGPKASAEMLDKMIEILTAAKAAMLAVAE